MTYPSRPDAWFITTKMPLRDAEGRIVGTFGISHDITARKQLEVKNQQLATLVDSSGDAIVGLDLDRRVTAWNRGAERLYGYSAEEMIGAPISMLIPPELEDETRTLGDRLKRGEQISHFETIRLRKDGSKVIISLTLSPIRDGEGRIVGTAAVGGDITEQKAAPGAAQPGLSGWRASPLLPEESLTSSTTSTRPSWSYLDLHEVRKKTADPTRHLRGGGTLQACRRRWTSPIASWP